MLFALIYLLLRRLVALVGGRRMRKVGRGL